MKGKETLFSKNNYDIQLEEVLDKKKFDDEAKSLILNILYKIEESYKDYSKVKVNVKLKSEIIEEIIDILENKCEKIEILNPEKSNKKFMVNRKAKEIKVIPNEVCLLEAIYYIKTPKLKQSMGIFDKTILKALNKGFSINNAEIIRDFNGWSWNNVIDNNNDKHYNLIYQDLLLLLGIEKLNKILFAKNIEEELLANLKELYGEKNANLIVSKLKSVCVSIYMQVNSKNEEEVKEYLDNKMKELLEINNKSEYISKITIENNKNMELVSKIENILKSKSLLVKNFNNNNIKQKYETIGEYKKSLKIARNKKIKLIKEKSNLINPFEYVKRKEVIENEIKSLSKIISKEKNIYVNLIELQRNVMMGLYRKIEVYDLKKELINLIYEIRYYNLLPVENNQNINTIKELEVDLRNIQKRFVNKLCENKVVDIFSKDYNINYNILKYIFSTKMTNINKIQINLKYQNNKLYMQYFDENVIEAEQTINLSNDDFNELNKKIGKKMRIII